MYVVKRIHTHVDILFLTLYLTVQFPIRVNIKIIYNGITGNAGRLNKGEVTIYSREMRSGVVDSYNSPKT